MDEVVLGKHSAELEWEILKFMYEFGIYTIASASVMFQTNPKTGRSYCSLEEEWNHITDWGLESATTDLIRYELICSSVDGEGRFRGYELTEKGEKFVEDKIEKE